MIKVTVVNLKYAITVSFTIVYALVLNIEKISFKIKQ